MRTIPIMREKAAENVACKFRDVAVEEYRKLRYAGWTDEDIREILNEALDQCITPKEDQ